jgi:Fe-S cluster assembly protein SufD
MNALVPPRYLQAGTDAFLARYAARRAGLPGDAVLRDAAAETFRRTGLPGLREEAWRYTNLRSLAETAFDGAAADEATVEACLADLPALPCVVFANGIARPDRTALPSAFAVRTGAPAFGPLAHPETDKLVALNTMLAEDGAAITLGAGIDGGALLLASVGTGSAAFHPRHAVHLAAGARLVLIEIARGAGAYLHNPVLSATVEEGATLVHLRLQDEASEAFHMSTVYADIAAGGTYDSFTLAVGARLGRIEMHARLGGSGAAAHLNAAQLLGGTQHADITTVVTHDAPQTASRQTVKSVLADRARGVFQGRIEVARGAQKTDGYQMSQALLLSPNAEIDHKPQLEIYADDVKCSHGSTIGELDPEQLFYLRSRGIGAAEARRMLIRAFLADALDPMAHLPGHALLEQAVAAWWGRQAP